MKKVLFATTALVATASVAAADVRISGYGRFGLDYNSFNENNAASAGYNGVSSTTITSRLRIQFDASAETDGGVVVAGGQRRRRHRHHRLRRGGRRRAQGTRRLRPAFAQLHLHF